MRLSNESIKRGLVKAVGIIKDGCMIAAPFVVSTLVNGKAKEIMDRMRYCGDVGYDDAVKCILDSDMLSSSRKEAVSLLKRDAGSDYYKSVIYTVGSSLLSSDRIELIRQMSDKETEEET